MFILAQLAVILGFLVLVVYSKHLHIFLAPLNVLFSRRPNGLGPLLPMHSDGKVIDFEEADPDDDVFGRGKIEDFTWKGMLDFATCTECGRCQSQCPAWNTGKPLSPKLLIMDLRDHAFAKAPYLLAGHGRGQGRAARCTCKAEAERPLVGDCRLRTASSTPTCCGRAPPAAPACSSARSTSSTSTTSWTCAATRC